MAASVAPADLTHESQQKWQAPEFPRARTSRQVASSAKTIQLVTVSVPCFSYMCVWLLLLAVRCVCAAFLLVLALIYAALSTPEMEYYARLLSPQSSSLFVPVSWLTGVIGLAHLYQIFKILVHSFRSKKMVLEGPLRPGRRKARDTCPAFVARIPAYSIVTSWLAHTHAQVLGRQGFFGVESPYFEMRFLFREFLEMLSQTVQVYTSSSLIATQWINHLYAGIVCVNSFSTPLVKRLTRHSPALERLMCLAVDTALDLTVSIAVPLIITTPYYCAFDTSTYEFDTKSLYDTSWFVQLVMENRQVFVRNEFDLALKIVPHISIFSCLGSIQSLIRASTTPRVHASRNPPQQIPPANAAPKGPKLSMVASATSNSRRDTRMRRLSTRIRQMQRYRLKPHRANVVHFVFVLWGCGILAFHLLAMYPSYGLEICGCDLQVRPWFATKCACSVFEYNCYRQGTTSPSEDSFAELDETSLAVLVLSHCPQLVVPTSIRRFPKLIGIEIWNSTLLSWTKDAGPTQLSHPSMTYICLVGVNMTGIPDGLLYDIPSALKDIEIARCNITSLPDDLDERWQHVKTLYIEDAELKTVPDVLARMRVDDFSLAGNHIETLSPAISGNHGVGDGYYALSLSNNPLKTLPERIGDLSKLRFLAFENTQLEELPDWVYKVQRQGYHIYMYGTPFCANKSDAEIHSQYGAAEVLTCANINPRMLGRYPYELVRDMQLP